MISIDLIERDKDVINLEQGNYGILVKCPPNSPSVGRFIIKSIDGTINIFSDTGEYSWARPVKGEYYCRDLRPGETVKFYG